MLWALVDGDYEAVSGQLLRLSEFGPGADPSGFRADVADTVEEWFGGSSATSRSPASCWPNSRWERVTGSSSRVS